jgi:hypothetical protein
MVIRKEGAHYILYSKDGKKELGKFTSKKKALARERQIQYFKHLKGMMWIDVVAKLHKNHHHKVSGFLAAAGIALIIFPEPIVSNAVGIVMVGAGFLFAFLSDYIHRR